MNWRGGIKRDKYDALFSELVRLRSNWCCERCGKDFNHDHGGLHCSHVFGRRKQSVRHHPWNAFSHCMSCHSELGEHPVEFAEWAREKLGQQRYDALRLMAGKPTKFTKADKEQLHKHYLSEKRRLLGLRLDGTGGRIEFDMS